MKSSFSWPGRPPAEMISRNVERLLTSILDGRPKRGAFCTSTLDGTLKRGAFCTSILDGRLKRDAFLCTRVGAYCIRPTFSTIRVGCMQIRSTKRPRKGTRSAKGGQTCDSLSPTGPFSGAYLSTPYHATSKRDAFRTSYLLGTLKRGAFCTSYLVATLKRGAFCTSYLVGTPKRGAFCTSYLVATLKRGAFGTSYLVGTLKRGAFLCTRVGAYCIRPTKRSRMGTRVAKGSQASDSLSPAGPFGRAYAIRPYDGTPKEGAFASSFSIVVFSLFIFLCLSSLFSSGRSSFRCSVMCAP